MQNKFGHFVTHTQKSLATKCSLMCISRSLKEREREPVESTGLIEVHFRCKFVSLQSVLVSLKRCESHHVTEHHLTDRSSTQTVVQF